MSGFVVVGGATLVVVVVGVDCGIVVIVNMVVARSGLQTISEEPSSCGDLWVKIAPCWLLLQTQMVSMLAV